MKIQVRDDKGKPLGAIQIKVVDLDAKEAAKQKTSGWQHRLEQLLLKRMMKKTAPQRSTKKSRRPQSSQAKTIEIKISLPTFSDWSVSALITRIRSWPARTRRLRLGGAALILILLIGLAVLFGQRGNPGASAAGATKLPPLTHANPPYSTILPAGKTIVSLGGWVKIPRPKGDAAYVYYDRLSGTPIRVSEQPLPASFKGDTASSVAQLAQNSNANEKLSADGTTTYIEDTSDGQQFVILSKAGLLILINSASRISTNDWVKYVSSLN